ncbi:hypothetical protein [Aquirufa sp. Wall-65K1]
MKNQSIKWWPWVVAFILLINVGTLVIFWMNERRLMNGPTPKELIAKELQFDEKQRKAFDIIVKSHQDQSALIRQEITKAKKIYYQVGPSHSKAIKDLTLAYVKLEELNYHHFQQIRQVCNKDQRKIFDELLVKMISGSNFGMMGPRSKP